jgi:glucose-1-phosphate adenylyltransferase
VRAIASRNLSNLCYHLLSFRFCRAEGEIPGRRTRKRNLRAVMKDTLGVLLAGGAGERLYPLTRDRAKPAVTFGGIYRIIDITLSNCLNSDLRRVYILTQYKALSLNRHIREGWNILGREVGEFIEVLPPMKRVSDQWYQGTADAVYQNIYSIGSEQPKYVLILSGDHIYKMDYGKMLKQHQDSAADITLATIQINPSQTYQFGVVDVDQDGRINGFQEKPQVTTLRSPLNPEKVAGSMGVYIFNADVLIPVLLKDAENPQSAHDFGKDILPKMVDDYRVFAYDFVDENKKEALYWRDVGTLEAYYEANMDVVSVSPIFNLYDAEWPIRTHQRQYPPAKFVFAEAGRTGTALDSIVSNGCIVSGGTVKNSVLSPDVRVNSYTEVDNSILFSHVSVGRHCRIRKAILDRDVHIPEGTIIGYDAEADRQRYFVTESGITVVTRDYSLFENPVTVDYFTTE